MRCVLDTNVLVSALLLPDSKPRQALALGLQKGKVLLSFPALAELYEVLSRKSFRRYINEEDIRSFLAVLTRETEWVDVNVQLTACRDPKDDKFLELAVSGDATHIVTGDADLLVLNPFRGISILPPHSFLKLSFT
ncbi:MAG TPA: putative toxin-antitoxin system toxin component, PIN family [Candidatus Acidoferrales bacterium]|nr:putative toxin-antitoxin system toxin component, PIN family [Candidatus Acidoferrales bacterium]